MTRAETSRRGRCSQQGFSLVDTLIAIGIMAAVFVPVMVFFSLAAQRGSDTGQVTDTASFVQLSRFLTRDLSVAARVTEPNRPGQSIAIDCATDPSLNLTGWLRTRSSDGAVSYYVTRQEGGTTFLERRLCETDSAGVLQQVRVDPIAEGLRQLEAPVDPEDPAATPLQAPVLVSCTPRGEGDTDPCTNKVVVTVAGAASNPVSLEIEPRIDPEDSSLVRPRAVVTCTPSDCGGFRDGDGTFSVQLDASLSTAPEGIERYVWDFGTNGDFTDPPLASIVPGATGPDGTTVPPSGLVATGPLTLACDPVTTPDAWQVDARGGFCRYNATLTVFETGTDRSDSARVEILIRNAAPVVVVDSNFGSGTVETFRTQAVQFDTSETFDPDGGTLSFAWDFGDGSGATSTEPNPSHVYRCTANLTMPTDGSEEPFCSYTTRLTVSDGPASEGGVSTTIEIPVRVRNAPADIQICGPGSIDEVGQSVQWTACTTGFDPAADPAWDGQGVRDPDGNTARNGAAEVPVGSYRWVLTKLVLGPGGTGDPFIEDPAFTPVTLVGERSFTSPPLGFGTFVVRLQATDIDGKTVEAQRGIKVNTAPIARARIGKGSPVDYNAPRVFSPRGTTGTDAGALNPLDAPITLDGADSYDPDSIERPGAPADPNAVIVEYRWRVWREGWTAPADWSAAPCAPDLGGVANTVACEIPATDLSAALRQPQFEAFSPTYRQWPAGNYRIALAVVDNNDVMSSCGGRSPWSGCVQSSDPADLQWWVPLKINQRPTVADLRYSSPPDIKAACRAPTDQSGAAAFTVCRTAWYGFRTSGAPLVPPSDGDSPGALTYQWVPPFGLPSATSTGPQIDLQMPILPVPQTAPLDLRVTDSDGGTTVVRRSLTLRNHPPATAILVSNADPTHAPGTRTTSTPATDPFVGQITSTFGDPDGHVLRREWTIERRTTTGQPLSPVERIQFVATRASSSDPWSCSIPGATAAMSISQAVGSIGCDRLSIALSAHGRYVVRVDERDNNGADEFDQRELLVLRPAIPDIRVSTGGSCFSSASYPVGTPLPRVGNIVTFTPNTVSNITPCFDARGSDENNGGTIRGYSWSFPDGIERFNTTYSVNFRRCTGWQPGDPLTGCLQYPVTLRVLNEANFPTELTIMVRFNAQPQARAGLQPGSPAYRTERQANGNFVVRLPFCPAGCSFQLTGRGPAADPLSLAWDPDGAPGRTGGAQIPNGSYAWSLTASAVNGTLVGPLVNDSVTVQLNPPVGYAGPWGTARLTVTDDEGYASVERTAFGDINRPPTAGSSAGNPFRVGRGNPYLPIGRSAPLRIIVPEAGNRSFDANCSSFIEENSRLWERIPGMMPGEQAASQAHFFWTFVQNGVTTQLQGVSGAECVFDSLGNGQGATIVGSPPVQFNDPAPVTVTLTVVDSDGDTVTVSQQLPVRPPNPDAEIVPVTGPPANTPPAQPCMVTGTSASPGATSVDCSVWQAPDTSPQPFTVDGSNSARADGTPVGAYRWRLFSGSSGGTDLTGSCANDQVTFQCELPAGSGRYRVELTVWDGLPAASCTAAREDCSIAVYYLKRNAPPQVTLTPPDPANVTRGVTTTVTCAVSDPDSSITSRQWQVLQGGNVILSNASPANCQFNLPTSTAPGPVTFRYTATDLEGATTVQQTTLTVVNAPPVPSFVVRQGGTVCELADPSCTFNIGSTVTLDGTASSDPDGTIAQHCWLQRPPGATSFVGCFVSPTRNLVLDVPGNWEFRLRVTDNDGAIVDSPIRTVRVNGGPAVALSANGQPVVSEWVTTNAPPVAVTLSAAGSSDSDGIASYAWQVVGPGLNVTGTAETLPVTLGVFGTYTVTLTVTDTLGASTQVVRTLRVNRPPEVSVSLLRNGGPCSGQFEPGCVVNPPINLTATATATDPDGTVASVGWQVQLPGSETWTSLGSTLSVDLAPVLTANGAGQYRIRFTATDNNGVSSTQSLWVLNNPQPVVTLPSGPVTVRRGESFNVTASAFDPPPTTGSLTYSWRVTQGAVTLAGPLVTFSPSYSPFIPVGAAIGAAQVQVTVTDSDGGTATATMPLQIENNLPAAQIASNPQSTLVTGSSGTWTFSSAATDIDGAIAWIGWEITGPGVNVSTPVGSPTPSITYTFEGFGDYLVTLVVRDNDGGETRVELPVRLNEPPTAVIAAPPTPVLVMTPVTFDGTGSSDDTGVAEGGYLWEVLGLSNPANVTIDTDTNGTDAEPVITFAELGTFTVRLTVIDEDGAFSAPTEVQIQVVNP